MTPDREMDANKTAAELFSASFEGDHEDEPAWDAVRALRRRNDDEVSNWRRRTLNREHRNIVSAH